MGLHGNGFLVVDGLNLAYRIKNFSKNTPYSVAKYVVNLCRLTYKETQKYVDNVFIIGGVDENILSLERQLEKIKKEYLRLIEEKEKVSPLNIFKKKKLENSINQLNKEKEDLEKKIFSNYIYTETFWNKVRQALSKAVKEAGLNINSIQVVKTILKRKQTHKGQKIERDDDLTFSGLVSFLIGNGKFVSIYSNDQRLIEVPLKTIKVLNKNALQRVFVLTWEQHVADNLAKKLNIKSLALEKKLGAAKTGSFIV